MVMHKCLIRAADGAVAVTFATLGSLSAAAA